MLLHKDEVMETYLTTVHYRGRSTIANLYAAAQYPREGGFDVHPYSHAANQAFEMRRPTLRFSSDIKFPQDPRDREGVEEIAIRLEHFDRVLTSGAVERRLKRSGLRSVNIAELYAFGGQYPEEQTKYPLVCLGQILGQAFGMDMAVALFVVDGVRQPILLDYYGKWRENCRFPAVPL